MSNHVAAATLDPAAFLPLEGVSEESEKIKALVKTYRAERRKPASFAWRDSLRDVVSELFRTCTDQGWDGYDAEPISMESANGALTVLDVLPEGIQAPDVVPEPTGDIALEWHTEDHKHFSLSVTGPTLVYAGIFGGASKHYGEEQFFRVIPRTILGILLRYFPEA